MRVRPVPFLILLLGLQGAMVKAQAIDTVLLEEIGRYKHPYVTFPDHFSATTYGSRIDRLGRQYLYMACNDSGLMVLDISEPALPVVINRHYPSEFGGLDVMNIEQVDDRLYLSLGDFQGSGASAGLAIVDASEPEGLVLLGQWNGGPAYAHGCAIVRVDGDIAYLGAMEEGIVILDISDPAQIQAIGNYQPDPTWPGIASYAPNARGMAISDDVLFLAYDAGGLRAIDISTPTAPVEIGHYLNPEHPILTNPAYNNLVVIGDRAYCTLDYCGIEVVDISDPANMTQIAWLNPWNCIGLSWFGSDGHTNEIMSAMGDSLLFVSGADSEILAYDITDPDLPVLKGGWILPNDSAATWGVDVFGHLAVGNFINNHGLIGQPYDSKYGGVVIFHWTPEFGTSVPILERGPMTQVHPNPSQGRFTVVFAEDITGGAIQVTDAIGRSLLEIPVAACRSGERTIQLDLSGHAAGAYLISLSTVRGRFATRLILAPKG